MTLNLFPPIESDGCSLARVCMRAGAASAFVLVILFLSLGALRRIVGFPPRRALRVCW